MLDAVIEWGIFFKPYAPGFLSASLTVIIISSLSIMLSWLVGTFLALGQRSGRKYLVLFCKLYTWFIRGIPALILVFLIFFGLPQFGIRFSPYMAGILAIGLNGGAFVGEIVRGGLQSVPIRQLQAGQALGLSYWRILWRIHLPQAMRVSLPGLVGEAVAIIKNTSLLSTITIVEITLYGQIASAATFKPFDFFIASAVCYLVLTSVVMLIGKIVERRLNVHIPIYTGA